MKIIYYGGAFLFFFVALFASGGVLFANNATDQIASALIVLIFLAISRQCQAAAHHLENSEKI